MEWRTLPTSDIQWLHVFRVAPKQIGAPSVESSSTNISDYLRVIDEVQGNWSNVSHNKYIRKGPRRRLSDCGKGDGKGDDDGVPCSRVSWLLVKALKAGKFQDADEFSSCVQGIQQNSLLNSFV